MGMAEQKDLNGMVGLGHMYSYCAAHVLNGEENSLFNHKWLSSTIALGTMIPDAVNTTRKQAIGPHL